MTTLTVLSLGAGIQSTALAILAAHGDIPRPDYAIFADTGWEPAAVYAHLDRLDRQVLYPAGITLVRVSSGNIRDDALDPDHRFASMPLFIRNPDGTDGMARRQCTSEYKLKPIKEAVRLLLGAVRDPDGHVGRVRAGNVATMQVGISVDEAHRALDTKQDTRYQQTTYPLLDLGISRANCAMVNAAAGFGDVAKSACIGCPFHGNAQWRAMRDQSPEEWADAVAFDYAIRNGSARATAEGHPLLRHAYLHRSRVPLDVAPIDRVTAREWLARQGDLLDEIQVEQILAEWEADPPGCSPHSCRSETTSP